MQKFITADQDIETKDIMYALTGALPAAVESLERLNLPEFESPEAVARYLQQNVQYKEDGLDEQLIQLPTALLESGVGDCKSFSLFISAVLTSYGVSNGFRFVSYTPGDVTHVYNFYLDQNDNIIYLDACLDALNEDPGYVKKIDMQVGVIGKTPIVYKSGSKIGSRIGSNAFRRFGLSVPRNSYLALVKLNYRGHADALALARQNNPQQLAAFWSSLGGDNNKLNTAIDQGRGLAPLFGRGNAADNAYLKEKYEETQNKLALAEFVGQAIDNGYVLDPFFKVNVPGPHFGNRTLDWQLIFPGASNPPLNWPNVIIAVLQSIADFYKAQGEAILLADQGGPAVDIASLPTRPVQTTQPAVPVAPGSGPGRGPLPIGATGGEIALMIGSAATILTAIAPILRALGADNAAGAVENLTQNLPGIPPQGTGDLSQEQPESNTIFGMPPLTALLLVTGAFVLLTNKKR